MKYLIQGGKDKAKQKKGRKYRSVKSRLQARAVIPSPLAPSMTHFVSCQIRRGTHEKALEQAIIPPHENPCVSVGLWAYEEMNAPGI